MNRLVQRTLENRGYSRAFLREINDPFYDKLHNIDEFAVIMKQAHDEGTVITVFPDYDVDGISAGTTFFAGLSELGFCVNLFIPDSTRNYGVSVESVDDIMSVYPDTKIIVTCDTGISAYGAARRCRDIGVMFIVTDHHIQECAIDASLVVNPMSFGETYSHPDICGAFVVYQCLQYYADLYCNYFLQDQIRRLRVFAGIGTISDAMPLLYENRQVVLDAVRILRIVYGNGAFDSVMSIPGCDIYKKAFWGLFYSLSVFEKYGSIHGQSDINEEFIGFYFAPVFNSNKRLGGDMNRAFGVFFSNDQSADMEYLYAMNVKRKSVVEQALHDIKSRDYETVEDGSVVKSQGNKYAPYVYLSDAGSGILGLLATKLMEETGVPTFVIADDGENCADGRYHGSGRTPSWYPRKTALAAVSSPGDAQLVHFGGHQHAFGIGIDDESKLDAFVDFLRSDVPRVMSKLTISDTEPVYDFVISTDWTADTGIDVELFFDYLSEIENYRPFGKGFPAPVVKLVFHDDDVIDWKVIGRAKEHLKIMFGNGFDVLCWNQAGYISNKGTDVCEHVVIGHLGMSEYKGAISVNFTGVIHSL